MAAVKYPYTGTEPRLYSQYLDITEGQCPLEAEPGGSYAIAPAPGYEITGKDGKPQCTLAIPPADGRWGPPRPEANQAKAVAPAEQVSPKGASA